MNLNVIKSSLYRIDEASELYKVLYRMTLFQMFQSRTVDLFAH